MAYCYCIPHANREGPSRPRTAYVRSIGASAVFDGGGSTFARFGGASLRSRAMSSGVADDAFALPRRLRSGLTSAEAGALPDAAALSGALAPAAAADDEAAPAAADCNWLM